MSAIKPATGGWLNGRPPPLENGDRLTRAEFERRYEAMPRPTKAELIEGVVYMPSPVRQRSHGRPHYHLAGWLANYEAATPGVEGGDNSTARLDLDNEPQPDVLLFIDPAQAGRPASVPTTTSKGRPNSLSKWRRATSASPSTRNCMSTGEAACANTSSIASWMARSIGSFCARVGTTAYCRGRTASIAAKSSSDCGWMRRRWFAATWPAC